MMQLKFLAIAIGLLAFTSCTDEPGLEISEKGTAQNENVNPLIEAAQKAYDLCYGNTTRSSASFFANDIVAQTYVKSRVASPDTVLYIVNEANGNGFVALTAGEHPEILAVSDNGTIKDVEGIDNPGLKMFFNAATEYASQYAHIPIIPVKPVEPIDPIPSFKEEIRVLEDQDCPARVKVQWGQSYPEGLFCPNKYSGCVITAAAQVLSYFEMPDTINLTYENADKEYINLNWFGFKKLVDSHSWSEEQTVIHSNEIQTSAEENLGRFCRELGHRMHANYHTGGTGSNLYAMSDVIKQICPSLYNEVMYIGKPVARKHLGEGIIVMQGRDSGAGHAWIVDGYKYKVTEHNIYVYDGTIKDYVYSESESFTDVVDLQHLNWGWNGKCNGYYNIDVFKTDSAVIPDTDFNKDIYDFTTDIAFRIITLKH